MTGSRRSKGGVQARLSEAQVCVCFALRKATRRVTRRFDAALRPSGLKSTQFNLLVALDATGAITTSELARRMGIERTTLTRNLSLMAKKGWLRAEPRGDRRSHDVSITARGRKTALKALPVWRRAQGALLTALGPVEFAALTARLDELSMT